MNDLEWNKLKREYSRSNTVVLTDQGSVDFSLSGYKKTEFNGHPVTYDDPPEATNDHISPAVILTAVAPQNAEAR